MALIALKLSDVSLNILTLGALTVAIGRVIDDSIIIVENIYRRLTDSEEQLKGENLIISATTEVFKPIMSSTLVTIIVFLPLVFVSGSVGEMFRPFALAIAFSLLASLLVLEKIHSFQRWQQHYLKKALNVVINNIKD